MTTRKSKYEIAAEEMDALKDTGHELDGLTPVKVTISPNVGVVYSVRFSREEYKTLSTAADARGVKLSEIIRAGALKEARGDSSGATTARAVKAARKELRAAQRALEKTAEELQKAG
jgi:hypothetical protein